MRALATLPPGDGKANQFLGETKKKKPAQLCSYIRRAANLFRGLRAPHQKATSWMLTAIWMTTLVVVLIMHTTIMCAWVYVGVCVCVCHPPSEAQSIVTKLA